MLKSSLAIDDPTTWTVADPRPNADGDWAALKVRLARKHDYTCACCGLSAAPHDESSAAGFEAILVAPLPTFVTPDREYSKASYVLDDYQPICPFCFAHHHPAAEVYIPGSKQRQNLPIQFGFCALDQREINRLAAMRAVGRMLSRGAQAPVSDRRVFDAMQEAYANVYERAAAAILARNAEWRVPGMDGTRYAGNLEPIAKFVAGQSIGQRMQMSELLPDLRVLHRDADPFYEVFVRGVARYLLKHRGRPSNWVTASKQLLAS